jgi:oligosaccharide repeat unit polymerase
MAFGVAGALIGLACWAVVRLPALHPAQLWVIPWALASTLFAARLLPYRPMNLPTAALILGGTSAFVVGSLVGERVCARGLGGWTKRDSARGGASVVSLAAGIAFGGLALTLAAFIVQIVRAFGLRAAFISSGSVCLAVGAGATPVTIKYVYFAFAAVTLSTVAAARASDGRTSRRWLVAASVAGASMYFATGRANIILALLIGLLTWGVARPETITRSRVLITLSTVAVVGLLVFTIGGSIIGKTFSANEASTIDNVFTRHSSLSVLGVPYEYLATPVAGLQREVELSNAWGRGQGCATLAFVCQILRRAGLNAHPEPPIRAATKAPLAWNAYTGLDFWLIDGGLVLMAPIAFVFGALMGGLWAGAGSGRPDVIILYAIFSSTLLFSAYQNSFFAPHIVGSAGICMAALVAGRWLVRRQGKALDRGVPGALRAS